MSNPLYESIIDNGILEIGTFSLKNGNKVEYYFNTKKIYSNSTILKYVGDVMSDRITTFTKENDIDYQHIVGVPYGSLPLSSVVSHNLEQSLLFVRKEEKTHGTKSLIEGNYEIGDSVVLIEDVITSGSSIIETIEKIENTGLIVSLVVVLFNRQTGGLLNVEEKCEVPVEYLYDIDHLSKYLQVKKHINEYDYGKIISSIAIEKKNHINRMLEEKENLEKDNEFAKSIKNYDFIFNNPLERLLMSLVVAKESALCLSLDVNKWEDGKKILDLVGEYIVMVKVHCDLFTDINSIDLFIREIRVLARKRNFLIMEDVKLADVDKITYRKIKNSFFKYHKWANYLTIQGLTCKSVLDYCSSKEDSSDDSSDTNYYANLSLVTDMNQKGAFIDEYYRMRCRKLMKEDTSMGCIISQDGRHIVNKVKLTPGISIGNQQTEKRNYRDIKTAIEIEDNHIIIVGNSILKEYDATGVNNEPFTDIVKKYAVYSYCSFKNKYSGLVTKLKEDTSYYLTDTLKEVLKPNEIENEIIVKENDLLKREKELSKLEKKNELNNVKCLETLTKNATLKGNLIQSQYYSVISMMIITFFFNYQTIMGFLLD